MEKKRLNFLQKINEKLNFKVQNQKKVQSQDLILFNVLEVK